MIDKTLTNPLFPVGTWSKPLQKHTTQTVLCFCDSLNWLEIGLWKCCGMWCQIVFGLFFSSNIVAKHNLNQKFSKLTLCCDVCAKGYVKVTLATECKASDMLICFSACNTIYESWNLTHFAWLLIPLVWHTDGVKGSVSL